MNALIGSLPRHIYVYVDTQYTHKEPSGFVPAVWFGLVSYPGRMWGCNVMLESGSIYRSLPPHSLAFSNNPELVWSERDSQTWDCYGEQFSCVEYEYLRSLDCAARSNGNTHRGTYLFTVAPIGDGFSAAPEQAKEFTFIKLENDRLTVQPTNHIVFKERSFTVGEYEFPTGLKRQTEIYSCE